MPNRKKVPTEEEFQETVRQNVDEKLSDLREKKLQRGKSQREEAGRSSSDEAGS